MSRPDFFSRPPEWTRLEGSEDRDKAGDRSPEPPAPRRRGWFRRRPNHPGLGTKPAGPGFSWPAAPAGPAGPASGAPAAPPPTQSSLGWSQPPPENTAPDRPNRFGRRKGSGRTRPTATPATGSRRAAVRPASGFLGVALAAVRGVGVFLLVAYLIGALVSLMVGGDRSSRRPQPTRTQTQAPAALPALWSLRAPELRPDLSGGAEIITTVDGTFDDNRVVDAGATWAVLTGDAQDRRVAVHGIASATGRALWREDLPDGICASELLDSALLCATSTAADPATGLGTRWRISLLDPATGRERRGIDFAGWLTLIHVDGDRVMLVEQRQPAPHALITGLDADLRQRWRIDLRDQPHHAGLFSNNRIYNRKLPIPEGPALDRPRIRKVADGLTALWAGQTTAFLDLRRGRLAGMPRCSRLVDDGTRLWCNAGAVAVAHDYALKRLHETAIDTRLAFPRRDPRAGDVTDPVFLEADGRAVRVDPETGRTLGPLAETRNGSAFGMTTSPSAAFVDGLTLLSDSSLLVAVDARTGTLHWQQQKPGSIGEVWAWKGDLLFAGSAVRLVEPRTGRERIGYRQTHGLYTIVVADALVGIGPDELARLRDP